MLIFDACIYNQDTDMNIRVYSEEQDDIEKDTWQIVVK